MKKNPSQPSTEQIHIRTPRLAARFSPIVTLRKSDHWQSAQRPSNQARGYVFRRRPSRWTRSTLSAMQCRRPFKRPPMSGRISQQQARRSKIPPESLPAEPGFPTILISESLNWLTALSSDWRIGGSWLLRLSQPKKRADRKRVVSGKSVSIRVYLGG